MDAVMQDDGVPSPQEQQPKTKRRLSRLQHMTVNKPAASPSKDQELRHKLSPAAKAGFRMPEFTDDMQADLASQPQQLDALPADARSVADKHSSQQTPAQAANAVVEDTLVTEPPTTTPAPAAAAAAASTPQPMKANVTQSEAAAEPAEPVVSAAAAAAAAALKPVRLQDSDLDDDDDEWEDQPAPFIPEDTIEQQEHSKAAQAAAATDGGDAVPAYDSTNRRRAQYDDEDEWEQLLQNEKHTGTHAASSVTSQEQEADVQQGSVSGSACAQGDSDDDGDNILADDPDAINANTQRVLRDMSASDCLGKGFKPQVAPLNSLLEKLAARQAALEAKAKRCPTAAYAEAQPESEAAAQLQPALTLEQLKAHLEQHSLGQKQQKTKQQNQQQQAASNDAAEAAAATDSDNSSSKAAAITGNHSKDEVHDADMYLDVHDDSDDLEIEPPQQQEKQQPGGNMLLPETQELLQELHPAVDTSGNGLICGAEAMIAGSAAPESGLDLQLDAEECSDAVTGNADISEHDNGAGADEQEAGSGDEAHGEGEEDEEELLSSSDEDMLSEDEESDAEEQQQSSEIEAEPLPWEEEELHDSQGGEHQRNAEPDTAAAAGDRVAVKGKKHKLAIQHRRVAGGFVEAEADLSEDEDGQGLDSDEDEDSEDDAMLAELIADVKEGRLDEARRAALHAQWMHGQDGKDIEQLIDAMKKGFRRKRKPVAGLDDDDEGNNAAARRRRAELQGIIEAEGEDDEPMEGTDRLQRLDLTLADDEGEAEAAAAAAAAELANREKQKKIHKLQLQASESQQDSDVIQLLSMEVDEGSQHTAALLSKSASFAAASHGAGRITGSESVLGSLRAGGSQGLRVAAVKQGTAAAAGLGKSTGLAAGGFTFQMFGKDVTNSSLPKQMAGSFLGRQSSSSVTVRAASNYGASRSFVFGSDPSNYSNPGLAGHSQQQQEDSKHAAGGAVGPSSFAGLSKLIPEAAAKVASRLGPGSAASKQQAGGNGGSSLLHMLQEKKGGSAATAGHSILKQHVDAVGAKFKANSSNSRSRAGDDATSRGAWDF